MIAMQLEANTFRIDFITIYSHTVQQAPSLFTDFQCLVIFCLKVSTHFSTPNISGNILDTVNIVCGIYIIAVYEKPKERVRRLHFVRIHSEDH